MKTKLLPEEKQAIKDMKEFFKVHPIEKIKSDIIQTGYDQASCNDEHMVDRDDAIRIIFEADEYWAQAKKYSSHSLEVIAARIMIDVADTWRNEFPNDIAS